MNNLSQNRTTATPSLSVIIPVYNEEKIISGTLDHLQKYSRGYNTDIVVVDGQSKDQTVNVVRDAGYRCIVCEKKGRAAQMNLGVKASDGDILYFVHADSIPPESYVEDIFNALDDGYEAGCYRFRFDSNHLMLRINSFFTRFDRLMCRGGDQTLFITRQLFEKLEGFKEDYLIMEDFEFIERIQEKTEFKIIPKDVIVSARKYKDNNYLKVNITNFIVFMMYFWGASQETMIHTYKRLIYKTKFG